LTDYLWDANGNLKREPGRYFYSDYRNMPYRIVLDGANWDNYLDFVYDADRRRVKKVYDKGYVCECDPPQRGITGANRIRDTALTPVERLRFDDEGRDSIGSVSPRSDDSGQGEFPAGPDNGALDAGMAAAGPGGDCVCRRKITTHYLYTYDGRLLREFEGGVAAREYIYAGDKRIAVYEKEAVGYGLHYFLTDHLGSTRCLVNSSGDVSSIYDYYPYGTLKSSTVNTDTKLRYTGKELDDEQIEQYYFGARYLNGVTLRFNSIDPQESRYPGWSPYCYALANPMKLVDPDGEAAVVYDPSRFLTLREKTLGWAPPLLQEIVMPSEPIIGPAAMATGPVVKGTQVAAKAGAGAAKPGVAQLIARAREFSQAVANKAEDVVGGKGPKAGTAKHEVLKKEIKAHGEKLQLSSEVSYKGREPVKHGRKGSVRIDAVLGWEESPVAVFDLKTGQATLAPQRTRNLRKHLPKRTPIEEIKPIQSPE
jgi:RHS repeat-associated protein